VRLQELTSQGYDAGADTIAAVDAPLCKSCSTNWACHRTAEAHRRRYLCGVQLARVRSRCRRGA
jgi:hypothetical protein